MARGWLEASKIGVTGLCPHCDRFWAVTGQPRRDIAITVETYGIRVGVEKIIDLRGSLSVKDLLGGSRLGLTYVSVFASGARK